MIYQVSKKGHKHKLPHGKENKHLEDAIKNRIQYFKRVEEMMDGNESMQKSITFRKQLLDKKHKQITKTNMRNSGGFLHTMLCQSRLEIDSITG